ncbi:sigma-70 family RNA polymerase sigma factor [Desertimonas flava]|uniref:sigma-70 family RNA polymerase sigma factor n=1 Tax=Desertimonas flava TaxID=2064846 RepID=UPI0013C53586|nr:sigma-70 family RNA polymerase sigma factor [Desertimonas flava]
MHINATLAADRRVALDASWSETVDRLRAFVASRVADPELASDITQDVIVRSIASGALDRVDNAAAWLYRSARNAVIDRYRTRRTHLPIDELAAWPEQPTENRPNDATRELSRCLQPLLAHLSPAARDALERVDVNGETHQHAASDIGVSLSGMKSRVQRARRELRQLLERCCTVALDTTGSITDYHRTGDCGCSTDSGC